jgi:cytochrome bd ubiquinol oxidase subunit II
MTELWFAIASVMLAIYVVMDGFDFGAGALHLFVAKTDAERRQVLAAIGPYWDGNEVWLLALGGVLFVAFPTVLASGLSGFYFAIFLVLWSFILRGIAIEFRSHLEAGTWRAAWDFVFAAASIALPILFGAALGNLLRGLPLDQSGWFSLALFTDFTARDPVGILDWYTVAVGVFALVALVAHGAVFLAWKTDGLVHDRTHGVATWLYAAVALLLPLVSFGTAIVRPGFFGAVAARPLALAAAVVAAVGLIAIAIGLKRRRHLTAFIGSGVFLAGLLAATAAAVFPVMLRATGGDALSLTAYNASATQSSLRVAIRWWLAGIPLVVIYFATVFRLHRGKAVAAVGREGY